jgi:hypothetical protein
MTLLEEVEEKVTAVIRWMRLPQRFKIRLSAREEKEFC